MRVDTGGFSVDFTDALDAFVFDETDPGSPHFHGAPMKAVDIVAEFSDRYVFAEIKDPHDPALYDATTAAAPAKAREKPNIHWKKDRGKDVLSAPWFTQFQGDRINDHHLTLEEKRAARRAKELSK